MIYGGNLTNETKSRMIKTIQDVGLISNQNIDVFIYSHFFNPLEKYEENVVDLEDPNVKDRLTASKIILEHAFKGLKDGGILFIYSIPKWLPFIGTILEEINDSKYKLLFKYWIALDIDSRKRQGSMLYPSHQGLLMYIKTKKNSQSSSPFHLNTKTVREKYKRCQYCGDLLKDWGGKKHLMNPLGANYSDVWKDLEKHVISTHVIPRDVLERIYDLTEFRDKQFSFVHFIEKPIRMKHKENNINALKRDKKELSLPKSSSFRTQIENKVMQGDCIKILKNISSQYPTGVFDLAFADPPYNLQKEYANYADKQEDERYIQWCKDWLYEMYKTLKPGGALLVLNLPKWSIHLSQYLSQFMIFKHWIVWDAMSTPAGKLMPAHYSLLYYIKPGGETTLNYIDLSQSVKNRYDHRKITGPIDAPIYCLRQKCVRERKEKGYDKKVDLTDIWWDIPRIKHKKYRNNEHPCQLPFKLMERIILSFSNEGDIIMDPFSGTGTTAIVAKMYKRKYFVIDIDPIYINATKSNLKKLQRTLDGYYNFPRKSVRMDKNSGITKKEIEIEYIQLCKEHNKILESEELIKLAPNLVKKIEKKGMGVNYLKKIVRRKMEIEKQKNHSIINDV